MRTPTPPWQVDSWDLRSDLDKVRQQWEPLREILEDAAAYGLRVPTVSAWSCGEQAGHVLLAAGSMARTIEENLADPERNRDRPRLEIAARVLQAGDFTRGRGTAPPQLEPGARSRRDFLELLPGTIDAWAAIDAREDEVRSCAARAPHFVFGDLTCSDWVRMCAIHSAHHLSIVRDIRAGVAR